MLKGYKCNLLIQSHGKHLGESLFQLWEWGEENVCCWGARGVGFGEWCWAQPGWVCGHWAVLVLTRGLGRAGRLWVLDAICQHLANRDAPAIPAPHPGILFGNWMGLKILIIVSGYKNTYDCIGLQLWLEFWWGCEIPRRGKGVRFWERFTGFCVACSNNCQHLATWLFRNTLELSISVFFSFQSAAVLFFLTSHSVLLWLCEFF